MDTTGQINELFERLKGRVDSAAQKRVERTLLLLQQELKKLYVKKTLASSGGGGSVGGIVTSLRFGQHGMTAQIGFSHQADMLKFREFGVLPAVGAFYPAHTKIPPPAAIYAWISKAGIAIPEEFKEHGAHWSDDWRKKNDIAQSAEHDPQMSFAWAIAFSIRGRGQKPLRLMQEVLKLQLQKVKSLMQGE